MLWEEPYLMLAFLKKVNSFPYYVFFLLERDNGGLQFSNFLQLTNIRIIISCTGSLESLGLSILVPLTLVHEFISFCPGYLTHKKKTYSPLNLLYFF